MSEEEILKILLEVAKELNLGLYANVDNLVNHKEIVQYNKVISEMYAPLKIVYKSLKMMGKKATKEYVSWVKFTIKYNREILNKDVVLKYFSKSLFNTIKNDITIDLDSELFDTIIDIDGKRYLHEAVLSELNNIHYLKYVDSNIYSALKDRLHFLEQSGDYKYADKKLICILSSVLNGEEMVRRFKNKIQDVANMLNQDFEEIDDIINENRELSELKSVASKASKNYKEFKTLIYNFDFLIDKYLYEYIFYIDNKKEKKTLILDTYKK